MVLEKKTSVQEIGSPFNQEHEVFYLIIKRKIFLKKEDVSSRGQSADQPRTWNLL